MTDGGVPASFFAHGNPAVYADQVGEDFKRLDGVRTLDHTRAPPDFVSARTR